MSDEDATLPPVQNRRSSDGRIAALERNLAENTRMTVDNTIQIRALGATMAEVKTGNDSLLEMKAAFDKHLSVLCTWGKWGKRGLWGLLSLAGAALPIVVAAKQLGWL